MTGDEKWIFYDNPKKKKYYAKPGQSLPSTSTSTPRPNIHGSKIMSVSDGTKRVLFTMSCWNLAIPLRAISIGYNWFVWTACIARKQPEYEQRHDKVILLHDNARPHIAKVVKKYLETLKWDVSPHPPYSLDIAPSDYWSEGCSTIWQITCSLLLPKSKINSKIRSPPKTSHFFEMEFENCLRDGKNSRQRWTIL